MDELIEISTGPARVELFDTSTHRSWRGPGSAPHYCWCFYFAPLCCFTGCALARLGRAVQTRVETRARTWRREARHMPSEDQG